jgi:hypothetical protein
MLRFAALLLLVLALAAPAAVADGAHEHGAGRILILAPSEAHAGIPTRIAFIDFGADGAPAFHQQNHVRVENNGVVVYETPADTGHDYDGFASFLVTLPAAGTFAVHVDNGETSAVHAGVVVGEAPAQALQLHLEAVPNLFGFDIRASAAGPDGETVRILDLQVEVWRHGNLVWQTTTADVERAWQAWYGGDAGHHEVRAYATGARSPTAGLLGPGSATTRLDSVGLGGISFAFPSLEPQQNRVERQRGDALILMATHDPYATVPVGTPVRSAILLVDEAGTPVPATFRIRAWGPTGYHEHVVESPGWHEVLWTPQAEGMHRYAVEAQSETDQVALAWRMEARAVPQSGRVAGPILYDVTGLDGLVEGVPASLHVAGRDLQGAAFSHGESLAQVRNAAGHLVLQTKLHSHAAGTHTLNFSLPRGDYELTLHPTTLEERLAGPYFGAQLGDALRYAFTVAQGPGFPVVVLGPIEEIPEAKATPAAGFGVLFLALVAALVRRR